MIPIPKTTFHKLFVEEGSKAVLLNRTNDVGTNIIRAKRKSNDREEWREERSRLMLK
jgi:hypothetical protein